MKAFLDTNVLLDVLAKRDPFYEDAARIWSLVEKGKIRGLVSAISFTNTYYIVRKLRDHRTAQRTMVLLRCTFIPIACDGRVLDRAIESDFRDFEDAVQYFSAVRAGADVLISRNADHFPTAGPPSILNPAEFLASRAIGDPDPAR